MRRRRAFYELTVEMSSSWAGPSLSLVFRMLSPFQCALTRFFSLFFLLSRVGFWVTFVTPRPDEATRERESKECKKKLRFVCFSNWRRLETKSSFAPESWLIVDPLKGDGILRLFVYLNRLFTNWFSRTDGGRRAELKLEPQSESLNYSISEQSGSTTCHIECTASHRASFSSPRHSTWNSKLTRSRMLQLNSTRDFQTLLSCVLNFISTVAMSWALRQKRKLNCY